MKKWKFALQKRRRSFRETFFEAKYHNYQSIIMMKLDHGIKSKKIEKWLNVMKKIFFKKYYRDWISRREFHSRWTSWNMWYSRFVIAVLARRFGTLLNVNVCERRNKIRLHEKMLNCESLANSKWTIVMGILMRNFSRFLFRNFSWIFLLVEYYCFSRLKANAFIENIRIS